MATGCDAKAGRVSMARSAQLLRAGRARVRRINFALLGALVLVTLVSLCQGVSTQGLLYSPADVLGCYAGWFKLNVGVLFQPSLALERPVILATYPMYDEVITRVTYTVISVGCGALLAIAGMLYQVVFRNPIAGPGLLGVSSGATAGIVALVAVFGYQATYRTAERYLFAFVGGIAVLAIVLGLGKLACGRRRGLDLVDVLLVATIVSSLVGTVTSYVVNYKFTDAEWSAYYDLDAALVVDASPFTLAFLGIGALVSLVPVVALRFRMNSLSFPDEDARLLGIRVRPLRALALAAGSVMLLVGQTLVGGVGMASLVVPYLSRALYGAEFGRQLVGNALLGALVIALCRVIVSFIPFVGYGIPVGTAATFVLLPGFVWVMTSAQKSWGDR
ncbi:MAG: iron ABC transporter permease [Coriobacteriia bacterium]|nr:iron ABC transporter permease [Coriobacteriia bacterium]MBS5477979.1 iron ABC transporter permease [Coriobacteriia bacterium]